MIDAYLVDSIIIIKSGGRDEWGEPEDSEEISVMGKIEYKTRLIKEIGSEEVTAGTMGAITASAMILFSESIENDAYLGRALTHEDKIKFNDIEHTILKIDKPKAFSNPHYEVYVS